MFTYPSVQTSVTAEKGKRPQVKTRKVKIHGNKGFKEITYKSKTNRGFRTTRKSRKPLTKKEMACIRRCKFVPGLFKACEAGCVQE